MINRRLRRGSQSRRGRYRRLDRRRVLRLHRSYLHLVSDVDGEATPTAETSARAAHVVALPGSAAGLERPEPPEAA